MWLLASLLARAEPGSDTLTNTESGEYQRLSEELAALASKSAWLGVERTFQQLLTTGVKPTFEQWIRGAEAARALGDAAAVRERLIAANALQEDRSVIEWLWDIDHRYGRVVLRCDMGSHLALVPIDAGIDPDIRRAIEHATAQVHDACRFDGMLPAGKYKLYDVEFVVIPSRTESVDLRGVRIDKASRRKLKEAWEQPE